MAENNNIPVLKIEGDYIELCKLLKLENWVGGGGEAKHVITDGYVLVNGEVEIRKRKKIYDCDIVQFQDAIVRVQSEKES